MHAEDKSATPKSLQQNYFVCPIEEKLDMLWSFIQASKKKKILCFFSSAKMVRFVYESFRHMQPGIPLLHLHGRQKQGARLDVTTKFAAAKFSCLFATDVAARGLDFPAVDFVIQVDCPEDVDTYIHRVGRTARYNREGRGVLFLAPSEEEGMLKRLEVKKVPVEIINARQKKKQSIKSQLVHMCFKDPELKYLAQKAFTTYTKSLYIQKDKEVFNIKNYDLEAFAASLGLPGAPKIKFIKDDVEDKKRKHQSRQELEVSDSSEEEEEKEEDEEPSSKKAKTVRTKYDRMFERQNQDVLADHYRKLVKDGEDEDDVSDDNDFTGATRAADDDDFLAVKRRIPADEEDDEDAVEDGATEEDPTAPKGKVVNLAGASQPIIIDSNRREKLLKSKKKLLKLMDKGKKLVYDDEGNAHEIYELENEDDFRAKGLPEEQRKKFLDLERDAVAQADVLDKEAAKAKRKEKMRKRKERERAEAEVEASSGDEEGGLEISNEDALANFRADADFSDEEEQEKPAKKWFQSDSEGETAPTKKRKKVKSDRRVEEPQTLEDMEALAADLLS